MTYVILLSGRAQFGNLTRAMTRERLRRTFGLRACKTVVALIARESFHGETSSPVSGVRRIGPVSQLFDSMPRAPKAMTSC